MKVGGASQGFVKSLFKSTCMVIVFWNVYTFKFELRSVSMRLHQT